MHRSILWKIKWGRKEVPCEEKSYRIEKTGEEEEQSAEQRREQSVEIEKTCCQLLLSRGRGK